MGAYWIASAAALGILTLALAGPGPAMAASDPGTAPTTQGNICVRAPWNDHPVIACVCVALGHPCSPYLAPL